MKGTSNYARTCCVSDKNRITIVLTQIDKGSVTEMEGRPVEDAEHQSIKADLQNTREEIEKAQAQEDTCAMQASKSNVRMVRLKDTKAACMDWICQLDERTIDVKMPFWSPLITEETWNNNDMLAIDFDADSDISDTGDPERLHKDNLAHQIQCAAQKEHGNDDSREGNQSLAGLREKLQDLQSRLTRRRRGSKISDIMAELVMKVAGLCSEQISRLAPKRAEHLLDQSLLQRETYRNPAANIISVIGICAPAADALRANVHYKKTPISMQYWSVAIYVYTGRGWAGEKSMQ